MTAFQTNINPAYCTISDKNSQPMTKTSLKRPREADTDEPVDKKPKNPELIISNPAVADLEHSIANLSSLQLLEKTRLAEYGNFTVKHECDCWIVVELKFTKNATFKRHVIEKLSYDKRYDCITLVFQKSQETHQYPCAAATQIYRGKGIYLTDCGGRVSRVDFDSRSPFQHPRVLSMGTHIYECYEYQPKYRLLYVEKAALALELKVNQIMLDKLGLKLHVIPSSILTKKDSYLPVYRGLEMLHHDDPRSGNYLSRYRSLQGDVLINKGLICKFFSAKLADYTSLFLSEQLNNITVFYN